MYGIDDESYKSTILDEAEKIMHTARENVRRYFGFSNMEDNIGKRCILPM